MEPGPISDECSRAWIPVWEGPLSVLCGVLSFGKGMDVKLFRFRPVWSVTRSTDQFGSRPRDPKP